MSSTARRPRIVGIGGTIRPGSSTERALAVSLKAAEAGGAETLLLGGDFLARLPIFNPSTVETSDEQKALAEACAPPMASSWPAPAITARSRAS
ncbi:hypothetical protein [Phenylobacterium aquaticum]|uniref:hypothetical protein n=1 Tax=Phenylobacterium aquaticum TaxID=1763816 RepID=UPI001F5D97D5|nr:hypothetical protein [Phenylobacterium aquaticum]MCI3131883.1 hypothetical protein [Phenylobacterium aquaticum]